MVFYIKNTPYPEYPRNIWHEWYYIYSGTSGNAGIDSVTLTVVGVCSEFYTPGNVMTLVDKEFRYMKLLPEGLAADFKYSPDSLIGVCLSLQAYIFLMQMIDCL